MGEFILNNFIIKGAAFDMDGTLIDCTSSRAAIQKAADTAFPIDWSQCGGRGLPFLHQWLVQNFTEFTVEKEAFISKVHHEQSAAITLLTPRPGIIELLDFLESRSIPITVVTNTDDHVAADRLAQCGISKYVSHIIGATTLKQNNMQPKPAADGFLLAAKMLNVPSMNMIGFEDSETGMNALRLTPFLKVHVYDETIAPMPDAEILINVTNADDFQRFISKIKNQNGHTGIGLRPEPSGPAYT